MRGRNLEERLELLDGSNSENAFFEDDEEDDTNVHFTKVNMSGNLPNGRINRWSLNLNAPQHGVSCQQDISLLPHAPARRF